MTPAALYEAYYVGLNRETHVATVSVDPASHALAKTSAHKMLEKGVTPFVKTVDGIANRVVSIYHPLSQKVVVSVCKTNNEDPATAGRVIEDACKETTVESIKGKVEELQALYLGYGRVLLVYTQNN